MIAYKDIRHVHLEISSRCNSVCPGCPRNYRGVDVIDHYPLCEWTLDRFQQVFVPEFIAQLLSVQINGNYGDFITARDGLAIVQYLRSNNSRLNIGISTNASGQPHIWQQLAETAAVVEFRLDGLSDTHHLYRQQTNWHLIISNAEKFIAAGGKAIWSMIVFTHNRHQIEQCRELADKMGFMHFNLIDNPMGERNSFPVFTKDKRLSHVVGDYDKSTDWDTYYGWYQKASSHPEWALEYVQEKSVDCFALRGREIYVSANGEVSPCCYTGFYPNTNHTLYENLQLAKIISKNNAQEHGLAASIAWFDKVQKSWSRPSVAEGKLLCCNEKCGKHDAS